jgi:hypothetical protein
MIVPVEDENLIFDADLDRGRPPWGTSTWAPRLARARCIAEFTAQWQALRLLNAHTASRVFAELAVHPAR